MVELCPLSKNDLFGDEKMMRFSEFKEDPMIECTLKKIKEFSTWKRYDESFQGRGMKLKV
jgi:hypothetical protein